MWGPVVLPVMGARAVSLRGSPVESPFLSPGPASWSGWGFAEGNASGFLISRFFCCLSTVLETRWVVGVLSWARGEPQDGASPRGVLLGRHLGCSSIVPQGLGTLLRVGAETWGSAGRWGAWGRRRGAPILPVLVHQQPQGLSFQHGWLHEVLSQGPKPSPGGCGAQLAFWHRSACLEGQDEVLAVGRSRGGGQPSASRPGKAGCLRLCTPLLHVNGFSRRPRSDQIAF